MKIRINKYVQLVCFALFFILCSIATFNKFKQTLFDYSYSGDETYFESIYDLKTAGFELITSVRSQFYTFCSSLINLFINNPILSARVTSLVSFFLLFAYFINAIRKLKIAVIVKIQYIIIIFFTLVLSRQVFIGVSDFTAYFFLIIFIIELSEYFFQNAVLSSKKVVVLSLLLALSIITRPTVLVVLLSYFIGVIIFYKNKILNFKLILIPIFSLIVISIFNYGSIKNNGKILLDVKEVPKSEGTSWLERNYLMAKFWDEGTFPSTRWVKNHEVVEYKKHNPDAFMPKSNFDLLLHEPVLYAKQMVRMFISANYTMFLFTNVLYLFAVYLLFKKRSFIEIEDNINNISFNRVKFTLFVLYLSIIGFSYLAIKMFEFRWVIPVMIVFVWYFLNLLPRLKTDTQNLLFTFYYILFCGWLIKGYKIFLLS